MDSVKLELPKGESCVRVRLIDTTALMTIKAESFVKPVIKGHEFLNVTDVAFFIEHSSGKKVLFDAGTRKDWWNLPMVIQKRLGDVIPSLKVEKNVNEILVEKGISLQSIDSVIWSHYHWDHTGDMSQYPPSTSITVGPGFTTVLNKGAYPTNDRSPLSESDLTNRHLNEISFPTTKIGNIPVHDFFGDGSLYLLDTPGHCIGHICALARTTSNPATFIFMGGDICHFPGTFRPNSIHPLPETIPQEVLDKDSHFPTPCPCSLFTDLHPTASSADEARTKPFYNVSDHERSAYVEPKVAQESVRKMMAFDQSEDVLVCIAHDPMQLEVLPVLNKEPHKDLNRWKEEGWKERLYWGWLNELPRGGRKGRDKGFEGLVRPEEGGGRGEGKL